MLGDVFPVGQRHEGTAALGSQLLDDLGARGDESGLEPDLATLGDQDGHTVVAVPATELVRAELLTDEVVVGVQGIEGEVAQARDVDESGVTEDLAGGAVGRRTGEHTIFFVAYEHASTSFFRVQCIPETVIC